MAPTDTDLTSKYEVRHQIGKGSFGSAFLVTNKQDRKDYVLKRVRLAKQTKWQRNSTMQERDLVMALQHPFIVPCVESWMVQDHTVNMIYGYCEKGDLSTHLAKVQRMRGQVDEQLMMKWLCQLLLALDYLQTMKVLHRDIKTSNVLLTCDMDAQLGDFGLATMMQAAGDGSKPEDTNLVGTPHYMSPELLSCKDYGFKTDVWSLGCVFYELTAQRPTFNAFNIHGLVSKIKKNKLAPLPDGYSTEWKEVVGLMLCKNPDRRPSVQELMGLPQLRPALLEARARAKAIMPDVKLPPLLNPTPLMMRPRISGDAAIATDSDNSGHVSSPDRENLDVVPAGGSEGCDSNWSAGAVASQAIQEAEFQEIFRINSTQGQQQQRPGEQDEADSDCHLTDKSRCSISSRGSSSLAGSLRSQSATGAASALEAIKRLHQRVRQPGISKMSPGERVAAAIAAARAGKKSPIGADMQAQPAAAPAQQADGVGPPQLSRQSGSNSSNASSAIRSLARRSCPLSASSRPPSVPLPAPAAVTDGGAGYGSRPPSSTSRPHTGRAHVAPSPRPAWNAGPAAANGTAGALHRQRSANNRAAVAATTPTLKSAAIAAAGKTGAKSHHAPPVPASHSQHLQQQDVQRQHKQQQPRQAEAEAAAAEQHVPESVQRLLDKSQELSRRTVQLQQQHAKPPKPQRPGVGAGARPSVHLQREVQQQHQVTQKQAEEQDERQLHTPVLLSPDADDSDDEYSSSAGQSAIKRLQFDSISPGSGLMQSAEVSTPRRLSDATSAATDAATPQSTAAGSALGFSTPQAATPDMFAAARGTSFKGTGDAAASDHSPVLWGSTAAVDGKPDAQEEEQQQQLEQPTPKTATPASPSIKESVYRSSGSPSSSGEMLAGSAAGAGRSAEPASEAGCSSDMEQRLQLLESVVHLMGGLYAKGRWQEMGNVLCSSSLLPSAMQSAVQTASLRSPSVNQQQSTAGQGTVSGTTCNDSRSGNSSGAEDSRAAGQDTEAADGASSSRRELKLGDWVVLGRSKKVKGRIRYIGAVAWDAKGEDWVGMELDAPCGTHGTQQGITYFTCPPRCAAFHRASKLMSA